MVDGSLIYWFLEQLPLEARDQILLPILEAWGKLRQAGIPIIGYLSAARNNEAKNLLRLLNCPYPVPDCINYCPDQLDYVPCKKNLKVCETPHYGPPNSNLVKGAHYGAAIPEFYNYMMIKSFTFVICMWAQKSPELSFQHG